MKTPLLASMLGPALFAALALAADDGGNRAGTVPPVLRYSEPPDNVIVTLPGPAPEPVPVPPATIAPAVSHAKAPDEARPFLRRTKREYPPGFEQDSPKFLQGQIGEWREFDVHDLLGQPLRQRASFDDNGKQNGVIYAFDDPTGRYKEFELDFASDTGALRTVFVYPVKMTWQECRQTYGGNVNATDAAQGRKFYSYLNRRMDVLVDAAGKVVSFGLY